MPNKKLREGQPIGLGVKAPSGAPKGMGKTPTPTKKPADKNRGK